MPGGGILRRYCGGGDIYVMTPGKATRLSFRNAIIYHKNGSFCQDRLGTNIGKTHKKSGVFLLSNVAVSAGKNITIDSCTFQHVRKRVETVVLFCNFW